MRVVVEADGGSRGNPGPAGCGAVVRDAAGAVLAERSKWLGVATNNVAEYQGLLAGLRAAAELGADDVAVRMDSKLVVEQLSGRWKIKHEALRALAEEARELVAGFTSVTFDWIPRAENAHADRLANAAMDDRADGGSDAAPTGTAAPAGTAPESGTAAQDRTRPSGWNGAVGSPTKILLVRHGQTAMSVDRRYSGRGDVPLTELGERQARAAAARLAEMDGVPGAPVLASPLGRTRQTAEAIAAATGSELTFHDGLLETDFGGWEGLTFTEAAAEFPRLHRSWLGDSTVEPPDGESLEAVFERVTAVRDEIVDRYAGRTVVVVSHVTPIKAMLRLGLDVGPSLYYRLHLDLASLSIVEFYPDDNASVRLVNDISHL
ncbi:MULTISPECIES: bifunctional RNase H/acid phosphatase [unclassified Saccharopolyspora]|uniref:bifunctional RNase H/acid phosphatase n=1 Tax=unclassified Saccharopolyspora TaxID=2646250 RepID=UPI001CD517DE|nr:MULTISPECIES: bifunctional RNase H/acid phosphatase [unclassified Saccharopolyspora]MCA1186688.1 bifunctional RNase H/acid phosphatase [Saccharopolyspora sp. 6T]MCA1225316.1 bifunctional RNase H/acid phosphatase [Saccharopolyspora sp. 6M]MCA1278892.1 bifunctional RNase H/acid phosphatase [Saccharopolyspora sp. 7B]